MRKKFSKLQGLLHSDFEEFVDDRQIILQKARLIPMTKMGDEMALTSIFLSALRIVKEFRDQIFSIAKIPKSGKAYYFTEVSFPELGDNRLDGLLIIVVAGKIKESVFFEMKNKNNQIDSNQISRYAELARRIGVQKIITVSNEFVSDPTNLPYDFKSSKNLSLFHLSWTYILTIAQILLQKNETNIDDNDQVEVMKEVTAYFENKDSGVSGFTRMKSGWKDVVEKIVSNAPIKSTDNIVEEAVLSWIQEEMDMALMLSRELGILVGQGHKSKKQTISSITKQLITEHKLLSSLRVDGSVSDIEIEALIDKRTIGMSVTVDAPLDKGLKGRISWIGRQLEYCEKKYPSEFEEIVNNLWIEAQIKFYSNHEREKYNDLEKFSEIDKSREIIAFKIILVNHLGKQFDSVTKFVELIEKMLLIFYQLIVQNLSNWDRPAPKIKDKPEI